MTPLERAGLRTAIEGDDGRMSFPSSTIRELLDDLDAAEQQLAAVLSAREHPYTGTALPEMTDADKMRALYNLAQTADRLHQRAVQRVRERRDERDQARQIARMFVGYTGVPCAKWLAGRRFGSTELPDWLTGSEEQP